MYRIQAVLLAIIAFCLVMLTLHVYSTPLSAQSDGRLADIADMLSRISRGTCVNDKIC